MGILKELKKVPNIITLLRAISIPVLLFLALDNNKPAICDTIYLLVAF